jgi:ribose/xylose/arabinose/galactoside ABC-type transport system permease subunit
MAGADLRRAAAVSPHLGAKVGRRARTVLRSSGIAAPLVLLWIVLAIATPRFLTPINLSNLSVQFAIIGALAIGTTAVIICREIDLSIGAAEGFCAVIAALVAVELALPWPLAIVAALLAGALVGSFNGFMVTRVGVPSFVVTLGTLGIVGGIALVLTDGQSIYGFPDAYQWIGQGSLFGIRAPLLCCGVLLVAMHFVMKHTTLGLGFYAVGANEKAAGLVGISPARTKFIALAISGASAGLAGILVSARLNAANPTLGALDLLDAIAAVVIGGAALTGGVGSILGTAAGVLLIVTIRNGLNLLGVNPFWQQTAIGSIIIVAAVLDHFNRTRRAAE